MNTNLNKKDLMLFGQTVANLIADGNIVKKEMDNVPGGFYPVTEKDVEKWLLTQREYRLETIRVIEGSFYSWSYINDIKEVKILNSGDVIWFELHEHKSEELIIDDLTSINYSNLSKKIVSMLNYMIRDLNIPG